MMNDTAIKTFAVWARNQLRKDVEQQMARWAIDEAGTVPANADTLGGEILGPVERRQRTDLLALCKAKGAEQLCEQAAYTWFNRFLAIRFMELHDYLPCGMRFFSAPDGSFDPQVLKEALRVDIEGVDRARIAALVSAGDEDGLFRYLFLAQCNELAACMPDVFERVGSAMELLLPEKLLREDGVMDHMVNDIPEQDWREGVEIVGWMYQYYNTERKDDFFKSKRKASAEDLAPATQLFTPNWIVRYLVENSLGRLWMLNHPDSRLVDQMEYFIVPDLEAHEEFERIASPEDIKVCDPACGSGHILVYAFELLARMYEEAGYVRRDIPRCILEKNLAGMEIDPRAGALASFALTMKAMELDSRFLRRGVTAGIKVLQPVMLEDEELALVPELAERKQLLDAMEHLDQCGSLFQPESEDIQALRVALAELDRNGGDLFGGSAKEKLSRMLAMCEALSRKFDVVVANPPYMGSSSMDKWLAAWTKKHYPDSKRDLCTCFIERGFTLANGKGYSSLVTMQSWMFLGSFEELRKRIIDERTIATMMHIGVRGFDSIGGEVVSTTATVLLNDKQPIEGSYVRLVDDAGEEAKSLKAREAIANPDCGWFYRRNAQDFTTIPGSPIAYWASKSAVKNYTMGSLLKEIFKTRVGMATADNDKFLRLWTEVSFSKLYLVERVPVSDEKACCKWFPYAKGGDYRKWYGNREYCVDWANDGKAIRETKDPKTLKTRSHNYNEEYSYLEHVSWSYLSSGPLHARYMPKGGLFDSTSGTGFCDKSESLLSVLALLNSSTAGYYFGFLAPTLAYKQGELEKLPYLDMVSDKSAQLAKACIALSREDYDEKEMSYLFVSNPLVSVSDRKKMNMFKIEIGKSSDAILEWDYDPLQNIRSITIPVRVWISKAELEHDLGRVTVLMSAYLYTEDGSVWKLSTPDSVLATPVFALNKGELPSPILLPFKSEGPRGNVCVGDRVQISLSSQVLHVTEHHEFVYGGNGKWELADN